MDLLFSQIWIDHRLRFDHLTEANCVPNLTLSHSSINKLWTPEVSFVNSKKTDIHASPSPNIFLMIYPNGTVWANYRLQVIGPCDMNLELFPMDVQVCEMVIESYAYNTAKVSLSWRDWNPVFSIAKSKLADFTLYDAMVTIFIFLSLIEVAIVCYIEHKQAKARRIRERERKMKRMEELSRFKGFRKSSTQSIESNQQNQSFTSSFKRKAFKRAVVGENEYETARLLHQDSVFVEESNGDVDSARGSLRRPSLRRISAFLKDKNKSILRRTKKNQPCLMDSIQALTAISFGFGGTEIDMESPPEWTGNLDTIAIHSQRIINRVLYDRNYDKHLTPDPKGVTVSIELALQTFYDISETSPCYVNLELYPFNEEECELILESYAYNAANVRLKWRDWNPAVAFVFGSLVELAIVGHLHRTARSTKTNQKKTRRNSSFQTNYDLSESGTSLKEELPSYGTFYHEDDLPEEHISILQQPTNGRVNEHRPSVNFGALSEFTNRTIEQSAKRAAKNSINFNYKIFQSQFIHRKIPE
uniref:Neurotransmitter-gated ion-channel ligand-binding domain-containing protein n=1 Tax=Ditylenchus dipsaci TaxID=166011 RepID=A0A915D195_9BILA